MRQILGALCVIALCAIALCGWPRQSLAATWQEDWDIGLSAFDLGDYPRAIEHFDAALSAARDLGVEAESQGLLLEHLATAYLADEQFARAQDAIGRWDRVIAENQDQSWADDHGLVRDRLSAYLAESTGTDPLEAAPAGETVGYSVDDTEGEASAEAPKVETMPEAPSVETAPEAPPEAPSVEAAAAPPQPSGEDESGAKADDTYGIHLASAKSENSASFIWDNLRASHPQLLDGKQLKLERIDLGDRGLFFRVVAVPFGSSRDARSACAGLQEQELYCAVVGPE